MGKFTKAWTALIAGGIGALGVAVSVTADNHISLNDGFAMAFAGLSAIGGAVGVAVVTNKPA